MMEPLNIDLRQYSTETNSYGHVIRLGILLRLSKLPFFADFKKFAWSKSLQTQPENVPYCGCYFVNERLSPDGDPNVGDIRFKHDLRVGFSVIIQNNDPQETDDKLDAAWWAIMRGLLTDDTLTNLLTTTLPDNAVIEGFTAGDRRNGYGNVNLTNETPASEMQFEMTMTYRTTWSPTIVDDFKTMHVRTAFPIDGTAADQAKVKQVEVEYDLEEN